MDTTLLEEMVDAIRRFKGRSRRPRNRPDKMHADKGYDSKANRAALRKRGITPRIARRGVDNSEKLGRHSWVVERKFAWPNRFRRLAICYERRLAIRRAFRQLARAFICWSYLEKTSC